MQYQTFRGADVQEALTAVKAALGPDAVIESTRHVSNGRRGGFSQSFVEVKAARPQGSNGAWPFSPDVNRTVAAPTRNLKARPFSLHTGRDMGREQSANNPTMVLGPSVHELEREMVALRTMLEELNAKRSPKERALAMLYAAGIDGRVAKELVFNLGKSGRSASALRGLLVERLRTRLRVFPNLIAQSRRQMIVCVGPTGAGKTTTLAKLAARARLDYGRSVAVISLDTFRVGAIEQWQRYSRLIGTAFAVARNAQDFEHALASSTAELVLVDTSGRHVADSDETWPLAKCLPLVTRHELHVLLVLPAFLRGRDAEHVTRSYVDVRPSGSVVTKLDETSEIGGVLQAMLTEDVPIAYTCNGPRVPEDIREAEADALIQCLLPSDALIKEMSAAYVGEYVQDATLAETGKLYERYTPLVRRIAMKTVRTLPSSVTLDDLLSAGWIGLAEALQRRTSGMNEEQFEAYASHRVQGAILDYLRSLDPLSRKLRGASRRISDTTAELSSRLGRAPEEEEIAAELGLSLENYHQLLMQIAEAGLARLELTENSGWLPEQLSPETLVTEHELVDHVATAIDGLPERLRIVLGLYYQEDCSFREIGEVLGVTESRACQLHTEAVHRIRAKMKDSRSTQLVKAVQSV